MKLPKLLKQRLEKLKKVRQAPHETDLEVDMAPLFTRLWGWLRPRKKPKQPIKF